MDGRVIYDKNHKVLICVQHQYAIPSGWLERHFREEHPDCLLSTRQQMVDEAAKLETVPPNQIIYTSIPVTPVLYLKTLTGYCCKEEQCGEIKGTISSITVHCRREHLWTTKKGEGWTEVLVQTFFQGNHRRYYKGVVILIVVISKSPNRTC